MRTTAIVLSIVMCALIATPALAVPSNDPPGFEKLRPFCGNVSGYVQSMYDKSYIAGANVTMRAESSWTNRFNGVPWTPPHAIVWGLIEFYALTDETGRFEFNNIPQGYYSWTCTADGYNPSGGDGTPVYSQMKTSFGIWIWRALGIVHGMVFDISPYGEPIDNVWISIRNDEYGGPAYPTTCDWVNHAPIRGTFTFELWGGEWDYTATWYAYETELIPPFDDPSQMPPIIGETTGSFEVLSYEEVWLYIDMT